MLRRPTMALAGTVVVLGAVVALVAATTATGRSQAVPKNTVEPSILYVHPIKVGTILNADKGDWSGAPPPITFTYQWLRCNDNGEACGKITNATGTTYTTVNADERHTIRLDVTATNNDGKATARANATAVIPAKPGVPVEVAPPTISGQAVVGQTLTATTGTWKGNQ